MERRVLLAVLYWLLLPLALVAGECRGGLFILFSGGSWGALCRVCPPPSTCEYGRGASPLREEPPAAPGDVGGSVGRSVGWRTGGEGHPHPPRRCPP